MTWNTMPRRLIALFLASGMMAVAGEMEINLVRNPDFRPGMDQQGPAEWTPYYAQNYELGQGSAVSFTNGMTIRGHADLFQLEMWDDVTPGYKFTCRMKSENGKGSVAMRVRDRAGASRDFSLVNRELNVWEDLELEVGPGDHYGFCMKISVPNGARPGFTSYWPLAAGK